MTLPQALRWLLYRDMERVKGAHPDMGIVATQIAHRETGPDADGKFQRALDTILTAIAEGRLTLMAGKPNTPVPIRVEPHEMASLQFIDTDRFGRLSVCLVNPAAMRNHAEAVVYVEPRFLAHEVQALTAGAPVKQRDNRQVTSRKTRRAPLLRDEQDFVAEVKRAIAAGEKVNKETSRTWAKDRGIDRECGPTFLTKHFPHMAKGRGRPRKQG